MKIHTKNKADNEFVSTNSKIYVVNNSDTTTKSFKDIAYQFVAYPIIVLLIVFTFTFLVNGLLPCINMIGYDAFSFDDKAFACYFMLPYLAFNIFILKAYFIFVKKMVQAICSVTKRCFQELFNRKEIKER